MRQIEDRLIYHYTTLEIMDKIIRPDACLYATHGSFFNDKMEFALLCNLVSKKNRMLDASGHNIFAFCFSLAGDDLSQWRAYAPMGGVSIGFSSKSLWNLFPGKEVSNIGGVHIKKGRDFIILMGPCKYMENIFAIQKTDKFDSEFLSEILFRKSKAFECEQEYRVIYMPELNNGDRLIRQIGNKPRVPIPMISGRTIKDCIRKIIVSPHGDQELNKINVNILLMSYGYPPNVIAEKSTISYRN